MGSGGIVTWEEETGCSGVIDEGDSFVGAPAIQRHQGKWERRGDFFDTQPFALPCREEMILLLPRMTFCSR